MTLKDFLDLHCYRLAFPSVRISLLRKDVNDDCELYVAAEAQDKLMQSKIFDEYKDLQVDYFTVIGGGEYPVELCIYLKNKA